MLVVVRDAVIGKRVAHGQPLQDDTVQKTDRLFFVR